MMLSRVLKQSARQVQAGAGLSRNGASSISLRSSSLEGLRQISTSFDLPDPTQPDPAGRSHQLTKIVATIGPTSEQLEPLKKVVGAGMKVMRLNFSHATVEEVELRMTNLAQCQVSSSEVEFNPMGLKTNRSTDLWKRDSLRILRIRSREANMSQRIKM